MPWSSEDIAWLTSGHRRRIAKTHIARALGRSHRAVRAKATRLGLTRKESR
jgi:hypothetical protein